MSAITEDVCRCPWAEPDKPIYLAYHDTEWGVPVRDDRTLFEFLTLESAQAGLSWYTVLRKRENYRVAFDGFDVEAVAGYDESRVDELLADTGIIRNRAKIRAAINNAGKFIAIQREFGSFAEYLWGFVGGKPIVNAIPSMADLPSTSPVSDALSRDLKRRGLTFVGSTICYSHMQATGMVNDHLVDCFRRQQIIDDY